MKAFLLMLSFFTRLPLPRVEYTQERYIKGIKFIPLVGVIIGAFLYFLSFAGAVLSPSVMGVLLFFGYVLVTGGLHLDGLADSCDALFSGRDRQTMLEIMKDSRSGSFGVLGLIIASAAYLVLLPQMPGEALLLFPVIGKCAPAIGAAAAPYVRQEGVAKVFSENCGVVQTAVSVATANAIAFLLNPVLLIGTNIALIFIFMLTKKIEKSLGGITGDILGLLCEASQIIFLFITYVLYAAAIFA
jgi:adenosylcobinamide-GDP ribazoletransferase